MFVDDSDNQTDHRKHHSFGSHLCDALESKCFMSKMNFCGLNFLKSRF